MADKGNKADAQFKKAGRADQSGTSVYEAERMALLARTEKLRAERLKREAEIAASAPPPTEKPVKATKAKGSKSKKSSQSLGDWMKTQQSSGRNS